MPIGAYDPWIHVHCNPEEAWRMGADCGAEHLLPVHHQTFRLSREPYLEPVERFLAAAGNRSRPRGDDASGARMVARLALTRVRQLTLACVLDGRVRGRAGSRRTHARSYANR